MNTISQVDLAIDSGITQIFDHIEHAGPMWFGTGQRWARTVVRFDSDFGEEPKVQLSIAMIDADSSHNLRLELSVEDISRSGFTAVAHTWSDTRIGRLTVNWTAIGSKGAVETGSAWSV